MDPIKRRVLELISADRVRRRKHFRKRCDHYEVLVQEAFEVLKGGAILTGQADFDARFGERHRFRGRDSRDRQWDVVVSVDEAGNLLWLHTVFPSRHKGRRR